MPHFKKIYIYNPSTKTGGTNNLLANLSILLSDNSRYEVNYIDYKDSPVKNIVLNRNVKINFIDLLENEKITIYEGVIISVLLSLKTIQNSLEIKENAKFLLWSTHPDDALKLLPSFNFWLRFPIKKSRIISNILHPFYKNRLKNFLNIGRMTGGIVWMDFENVNSNMHFYKLEGDFPILPIFTGLPSSHIQFSRNYYCEPLRIVILGRLTNFKVYPLKGLLEQIKVYQKTNENKITIDFIGDGPLKNLLEEWLIDLEIEKYNFKGHIDLSKLDMELINYHLLIGMATSTLEGAKLKIPSLVMNASYEIMTSKKTKLKWLFELESYKVGNFVKNEDQNIEGKNFFEILNDINTKDKWKMIGDKCYDYWDINHSPTALKNSIDDILEKNSFYFNKKNKSLLKKDLIGYCIDFLKSIIK